VILTIRACPFPDIDRQHVPDARGRSICLPGAKFPGVCLFRFQAVSKRTGRHLNSATSADPFRKILGIIGRELLAVENAPPPGALS